MSQDIEKLTKDKVYLNSIIFGVNCNFIPQCGEKRTKEATEFLRKAFDRLAELEDKLESGLLVELPCKLGDDIFYIEPNTLKICPLRVQGMSINYNNLLILHLGNWLQESVHNLGKTVFLTRFEAEAELERRKSNE